MKNLKDPDRLVDIDSYNTKPYIDDYFRHCTLGVIVTVYNVEPYIRQCLDSIVKQTHQELQIIVVDDGSTDGSGEICDMYANMDERIKVIHQQNQGVMRAICVGLEQCSCEYVTFVDGDDWIKQETYSEVLQILCKEHTDIVCYGAFRYHADDYLTLTHDRFEQRKYLRDEIEKILIPKMLWNNENGLLYDIDASLCFKVFKKELIIKQIDNVYNLSFHFGQDSALTYPAILSAQSIFITHKPYYYHRQRKPGVVAPYIRDEEFIKKLTFLYDYLQRTLGINENLRKQIDMFFVESVLKKKKMYCANQVIYKYVFPFDLVPHGSSIVLYGAGKMGQEYHYQITRIDYCQIVNWIDKKASTYGEEVQDVHSIKNCHYDFVVIAIASMQTAEKVRDNLVAMGVKDSSIVWTGK